MAIIASTVLLLAAVVGANIIGLIFPKIPLALFQIVAGLILSLEPNFNFTLEPEIFMLVIIAPLMFNDGQNQSLHKLSHNLSNMLSLAVSLVLVTVLVTGFVAHSIWSALPLSLAFMLAAIITPTDAVAVGSITQNVVVPNHVHNALEHESLFNDASGIVLFDLALGSFISGHFSIATSVLSFLKVFIGGLIVGWIIGMLIVSLRMYLTRTHTDVSAIVIPINVMTPLFTYWIAEHLGVSGILAVVASGLAHGLLQSRLQLTSTKLQIVSNTTWTILADILNGFVFVLLGATLPRVILSTSWMTTLRLVGIGILLYLLMFALRYVWVRFRFVKINQDTQVPAKTALQVATGGIHGTITLAMAFSIPTVVNGHAFALRDQIIFVAAVVILLSLLVAIIIYPIILEAKKHSFTTEQFKETLNAMVYHALDAMRQNNPASKEVEQVSQVITSQIGFDQHVDRKEYAQLMRQTQQVELEKLDELADSGDITENTRRLYQQMLSRTTLKTGPGGLRGFTSLVSRQLTRSLRKRKYRRKKQQALRNVQQYKQQQLSQIDPHVAQAIDRLTQDSSPKRIGRHSQSAHPELDKLSQQSLDHLDPKLANEIDTLANQHLSSENHDQPKLSDFPELEKLIHQGLAQMDPELVREIMQLTDHHQSDPHHDRQASPFQQKVRAQREELAQLMDVLTEAVIHYLNSIQTPDNLAQINIVRNSYLQRTQQFRRSEDLDEDYVSDLFIQIFQAEHTFVQEQQASQTIVPELANRLNEQISTDELVYMQNRV